MKERRVGGRFKVKVQVKYGLQVIDENQKVKCCNLSFRGARLFVNRPFSPGEEINLMFNLSETGETFNAKGKIIWSKKNPPYEIGVNFSRVTDTDRENLFSYILKTDREELLNHWWKGLN